MNERSIDSNYRSRIYSRYASVFQDMPERFDEESSSRWGKAYDYYLREWLPESKMADILELACGSGRMLHFLKTRSYTNVTGVDISPEQIAVAKQVIPDVFEADALSFLEPNSDKFDLIIGLDVIEHLNKQEVLNFLDSCHGALKKGGRIIIQTPNADSVWGNSCYFGDLTHETCFTPASLSKLITLCHFDLIECRETGPPPFGYSFLSSVRFGTWLLIRAALLAWNLVEIGEKGSDILTRTFLISAIKK